jgi:hypothetical protein
MSQPLRLERTPRYKTPNFADTTLVPDKGREEPGEERPAKQNGPEAGRAASGPALAP